jgi:hypothetical protein
LQSSLEGEDDESLVSGVGGDREGSGNEPETEEAGRPAHEPEKETLFLGPWLGGRESQLALALGEIFLEDTAVEVESADSVLAAEELFFVLSAQLQHRPFPSLL